MKRTLPILLALPLVLSACQSASSYTLLEHPGYNSGKLYIYRPQSGFNSRHIYQLNADGKPLGVIANGKHIHTDLPSGNHTIQLAGTKTAISLPLRVNDIKCLRLSFNKQKQPVLQPVSYEHCKVDITSTKPQN